VLENLVTVVNNGTQAITGLTLTMSDGGNNNVTADDTFQFTAVDNAQGGSDLGDPVIPNGTDILSASYLNKDIVQGNADVDFGLVVDLIDGGNSGDLPDGDYTLTIEATTS
jgi:hypothetical protein